MMTKPPSLMPSILTVALFASLPLSMPTSVNAQDGTFLNLCNRTDVKLNAAMVANNFYQGQEFWSEEGWFTIERGKCVRMRELFGERVAGFVFTSWVGDEWTYPEFSPTGAVSGRSVNVPTMCIRPGEAFNSGAVSKGDLHDDCDAPFVELPVAFFYSAGWAKGLTVSNVNLTGTLRAKQAELPSDLPPPPRTKEQRIEFAQYITHKLILQASAKEFAGSTFKASDIRLLKDTLSGEAEHRTFFELVGSISNKNALVGEGKRFATLMDYANALFESYDSNYPFDEVRLTRFGKDELARLTKKFGYGDAVENARERFIEYGSRY